ncbi:YolD-like family protein [Paenibacillus alvei]|uniref:YolD-like protein n=1 Tax=Paenibacillus alvei TaxID=44250 RepID=A0A383RHQ0_PAEAL|nr:YolD-like family protein [Paenibacillus alvei]SYX85879.1 YolD-like protein [Paenibacillus alvei]SYX87702.1 YolD-like protein [Paenibacillus alvei]
MSKLDGNGIFEGSRFIIPEHREAMLRHNREQQRRHRPMIDEQEWELIGNQLQGSMQERTTITALLFDPFEQIKVTGVVVDIDMYGRRFKLLQDEEWQWVKLEDVIEVYG